jgi:hypothetical protein
MKKEKIFRLVGIIAFVAIIGFSFAACQDEPEPEPKDALDGTSWLSSDDIFVFSFNSPNWTVKIKATGVVGNKGTYTISGDTVTLISDGTGTTDTVTLSGNTFTFLGRTFTKQ